MRPRLLAVLLLGALAVAAGWVFLAPPGLGGQTSYVVTRGESMLPVFHTGDLALVRAADSYGTGDVIAYPSPTLDVVVLHRVIEVTPDGLVTRGDSNDWTDPDVVAPPDVTGRLWLHVPKVGAALGPLRAALPYLLVLLVAAGATGTTRAVRGRRSRTRKGTLMHRAPTRRSTPPLLPTAAVLLLVAVALGLFSVRGPLAPAPSSSTSHTVALTYTAAGDPLVYDGGQVLTGDPVFTNLVPRLDVEARYQVVGQRPDDAEATLALDARVSTANGWQRVLPLAGEQSVRDGQARLRATVDLTDLSDQLAEVAERTGSADTSYRLELLPVLRHGATDGSTATDVSFAPPASFRLQGGQLVLEATDHERGIPLVQNASAATPGTGAARTDLQAFGLSAPVQLLQLTAAALALLGLAVGAVGLARQRKDPLARLDRPVVSVAASELTRPALDITSLNHLLDLAQRYDRPVLHAPTADGPVYMVEEGGTWYRHTARRQHARKVATR